MGLKTLKGREIFSAGTWNGDTYTVEDLDEVVRAYNETSATWKPPLKLGHDDDQKILQADGYPAAGWVGKVYRKGEKLFADFIDIPEKVYDLLVNGAYKKVSSELFWDIQIDEDKTYPRMLAGVALLGCDMPAVMNLSDIMAWYVKAGTEKKFYTGSENKPSIRAYQFLEYEEETSMDKAEIDRIKAEKEKIDAELADLRKYKTDQEAEGAKNASEIAALKEANREALLDAEVSALADSADISPAMKPYIKAILGGEKKEYSINVKGAKDKTVEKKYSSRAGLIGDLLALHAESLKLNTREESVDGEEIPQGDADATDKKVRAYAKEHKCSYGQALKVVRAGMAEDISSDEDEVDDE